VEVPHDESLVHTDANGLPIHGVIGGRQAWQLTGGAEPSASESGSATSGSSGPRSTEPGASSLGAVLSWSEEQPQLFAVFPFRHEVRYEALLRDGRLEIAVTVHASGTDAVPLAFGFHPYLAPGGERESWQVELPAMRSLTLDAHQIPSAPGQTLAPQRFALGARQLDDGFDAVAEPARFGVAAASRRIELTFLQGYTCAQVFAPACSQFICFEPMTAPANALRSGDGLRLLAPGESFVARFSVVVSDVR
jgi:aldose 1-epimerase